MGHILSWPWFQPPLAACHFEAFWWMWAEDIDWYTSEFILLFVSVIISSINTCEPIPLATIYAHASTRHTAWYTHDVVGIVHYLYFRSWKHLLIVHKTVIWLPSLWVFLACPNIVKGFLLTMERILWSSTSASESYRPFDDVVLICAFFFFLNVWNCSFGHDIYYVFFALISHCTSY